MIHHSPISVRIPILLLSASLLTAGCSSKVTAELIEREAPLRAPGSPVAAVAAAHPLAAEVGVSIMDLGGNALDAAVATAFTLAVVEPQASGLGGGGFIVYHDRQKNESIFLDYRELAPSAILPEHFTKNGKATSLPMRSGGLANAVPGMVPGLLAAHKKYGTLPLETLLAPAIKAAEEGFAATPQFVLHAEDRSEVLIENGPGAETFLVDGMFAPEEGWMVKQPQLAITLRRIATEGVDAVYGAQGAGFVAAASQAAGGVMQAADLASYQPRWREPLRGSYRGYEIVTAAPPSSGGIQLLQMLSVMEGYPVDELGPNSPELLALFIAAGEAAGEAARLHVADPATTTIPMEELLSATWTSEVRERILLGKETASFPIKSVPIDLAWTPQRWDDGNTTHLSVMDANGNSAALTQTINSFFGSGVYVKELGFLLNNEMWDFDFDFESVNVPAAGKIPRSSMSPTLIFKDGNLVGTIGTPGGTRIPMAMVHIIVNRIDFGMSLQQAIDAPRIYVDAKAGRISHEGRIETSVMEAALTHVKTKRDYTLSMLKPMDYFFGGAQGCWVEETPGGGLLLTAAADPRRDGAVAFSKKNAAAKAAAE